MGSEYSDSSNRSSVWEESVTEVLLSFVTKPKTKRNQTQVDLDGLELNEEASDILYDEPVEQCVNGNNEPYQNSIEKSNDIYLNEATGTQACDNYDEINADIFDSPTEEVNHNTDGDNFDDEEDTDYYSNCQSAEDTDRVTTPSDRAITPLPHHLKHLRCGLTYSECLPDPHDSRINSRIDFDSISEPGCVCNGVSHWDSMASSGDQLMYDQRMTISCSL